MDNDREISQEDLETFRSFTFARRVFKPYASLRAKEPVDPSSLPPVSRDDGEWYASIQYTGQPFDPDEYEFVDEGWDHEHCEVCWVRIEEGMSYWTSVTPRPFVELCEACHARIVALLARAPDAELDGPPDSAGESLSRKPEDE